MKKPGTLAVPKTKPLFDGNLEDDPFFDDNLNSVRFPQ